MKTAIVILSVIAVCSATGYVQPYYAGPTSYFRSPAFDSSYTESSRLGGNFAYRTVQGQAYQGVSPLAYAAYPSYPAYSYIPSPIAAPVQYYPYQPAFFEQPFGLRPAGPFPSAPAAAAPEAPKESNTGRQVNEDTIAVDSSTA